MVDEDHVVAGVPEPATARKDLDAGPMLTALFWLASTKLRRQARNHHVSYRYLFMHPSGDDLTLLARLADERALDVITDRVFPFDQIADAFAYLEQGRAHGKVIVQMVWPRASTRRLGQQCVRASGRRDANEHDKAGQWPALASRTTRIPSRLRGARTA